MKLKINPTHIVVKWALVLCSFLWCWHFECVAAPDPDEPGPAIYNAAINYPGGPKDTIDAQLKKLSAGAWLMIDAKTGEVLSSKNPDKRMYPASMTKMMTCILACESGRLNETITISASAAATPYAHSRRGQRYKLHDLLYRVMLQSDNGAAHAVGEFLSNDSVTFAMMMNEKARQLGMTSTNFVNAHGLPDDNHYTTASDMMTLMKYCMRNPIFAEIVSNATRDIKTLSGTPVHLKNTNKLFGRYDGCIGVKTGTTRAAGGCLASAVARNGMKIYLIIMKCEPARRRTDESIVLYDKGFEMLKEFGRSRSNSLGRMRSHGNKSDNRSVPNVRRPKKNSPNHDELIRHQHEHVPFKRGN